MKFAHSFTQLLEEENFPADWQAAAIRYRQLKKCIKKVQQELQEIGLTAKILRGLVEESAESPILRYMFHGTLQSFQPKLVLTVDATDGIPLDLNLSQDTRRSLERLIRRERVAAGEDGEDDQRQGQGHEREDDSRSVSVTEPTDGGGGAVCKKSNVRDIEITLYSDSEFFHLLTSEIATLEALQSQAESELKSDVLALGASVTAIAAPKPRNSKSDLYPWREIFRIYLESNIFFSNLEADQHKERTVEEAQERMSFFSGEILRLKIQSKFKNPRSASLFRIFMAVNTQVLRVMRFQAINSTAMVKILKKFDKHTALSARQTFSTFITPTGPRPSSRMSKAICHTLCTSVLNTIPQLDDYLCPICSSISIKPVRLACSHVFCVRCLVKLQRARKPLCPMCRHDCVLAADAGNLDVGLHNFLKQYFPKEAKEKQAENEKEVAMEQWRSMHAEVFNAGRAGESGGECIIC